MKDSRESEFDSSSSRTLGMEERFETTELLDGECPAFRAAAAETPENCDISLRVFICFGGGSNGAGEFGDGMRGPFKR